MYSKKDLQIIQNIILEEIPSAEKLILFGSYARNEAKEDSDIDIAVLLNKKFGRKAKLKILNKIWMTFANKGLIVDIVMKKTEDYNQEKNVIGTLAYQLLKSGKILWEKT